MGKIAFLFSGQGAQYTGMGSSLANVSAAAKSVFELAERIRPGTEKQCFEAPKEELSLTVNTQPCVYCVDLAAALAVQEKSGVTPDIVAGFSLGEIAALTFTGVFKPEEGFSFVCRRGRYMNEAAQATGGGMAAILKLSDEKVEELCKPYSNLFPVNYNCPGQVAVAGDKAELAELMQKVSDSGGRAVEIAVSGAFHSPYMDEAARNLENDLKHVQLAAPQIPIYSDCTAELYGNDPEGIRLLLTRQVNHPVRWRRILERMSAEGVDTFVEVGPGKTLSGLVKKTLSGVRIFHVEDEATLVDAVKALQKKEDASC